eukprot:7379338-Prymnesium_polylepis.1
MADAFLRSEADQAVEERAGVTPGVERLNGWHKFKDPIHELLERDLLELRHVNFDVGGGRRMRALIVERLDAENEPEGGSFGVFYLGRYNALEAKNLIEHLKHVEIAPLERRVCEACSEVCRPVKRVGARTEKGLHRRTQTGAAMRASAPGCIGSHERRAAPDLPVEIQLIPLQPEDDVAQPTPRILLCIVAEQVHHHGFVISARHRVPLLQGCVDLPNVFEERSKQPHTHLVFLKAPSVLRAKSRVGSGRHEEV